MRRSRFLQYKLMTLFSESKNMRIFKGILLIFLNIMSSLREMMLYYRIDIRFERVMSRFNNVEFINAECRGSLLSMMHVRDKVLGANQSLALSFNVLRIAARTEDSS